MTIGHGHDHGHGHGHDHGGIGLGKLPNPMFVVEKNIVSNVEKSVTGLLSEAKSLCTVAVEGLGLGGVAGLQGDKRGSRASDKLKPGLSQGASCAPG